MNGHTYYMNIHYKTNPTNTKEYFERDGLLAVH